MSAHFFPPLGGSKFAQNRWLVSKAPTPQATPSLVQVFCQNPNGKSKQSAAASVKPSRRQQELHVLFFFGLGCSHVFTVFTQCVWVVSRDPRSFGPMDPQWTRSLCIARRCTAKMAALECQADAKSCQNRHMVLVKGVKGRRCPRAEGQLDSASEVIP